jgi:ribosome biogenesis protein BRX1
MDELKMTGNCLKGSRPILSFDKNFESEPHLILIKEVFTHVCVLYFVNFFIQHINIIILLDFWSSEGRPSFKTIH